MKIVFGKQEKPPVNEKFENGHLYQHYSQPEPGILYLCTCGHLVALPTCITLFNITASEFKPEEFVDVTDRFELREVE